MFFSSNAPPTHSPSKGHHTSSQESFLLIEEYESKQMVTNNQTLSAPTPSTSEVLSSDSKNSIKPKKNAEESVRRPRNSEERRKEKRNYNYKFLCSWKHRLVEGIRETFGGFVQIVYQRTWAFILLSAFLCVVLGSGFLFRNAVDSAEKQYAIDDSIAQRDEDLYTSLFSDTISRPQYIIIRHKNDSNLMTPEFLNNLWVFHERILNLTISSHPTAQSSFATPFDIKIKSSMISINSQYDSGSPSRILQSNYSSREEILDTPPLSSIPSIPPSSSRPSSSPSSSSPSSSSPSSSSPSSSSPSPPSSPSSSSSPPPPPPPFSTRGRRGNSFGNSFGRSGFSRTNRNPPWSQSAIVDDDGDTEVKEKESSLYKDCDPSQASPKDKISGLECRTPLNASMWGFQNLCSTDSKGICLPPNGILFLYNDRKSFGEPIGYPEHTTVKLPNKFITDMWVKPKKIIVTDEGKKVKESSAFVLRYDIVASKEKEEAVLLWETALIDFVTNYRSLPQASLYVKAGRSLRDELSANTKLESYEDFITIGATLLLLFGYIATMNFSSKLYRMKSISAIMGGVAACLGCFGGMGFCYLAGLQHTNTASATPFLVLGVGVDDMFIILNSFTLTFTHSSAKERLIVTMKDCGLSITITTMTNLLAFSIGAISPYLAIRNFCIFTAAGLFMGYVMVLTFFLGWLCIDARQEELQRFGNVSKKCSMFCGSKQLAAQNEKCSSTAVAAAASVDSNGQSQVRGLCLSTFRVVSIQAAALKARQKTKNLSNFRCLLNLAKTPLHPSSPRSTGVISQIHEISVCEFMTSSEESQRQPASFPAAVPPLNLPPPSNSENSTTWPSGDDIICNVESKPSVLEEKKEVSLLHPFSPLAYSNSLSTSSSSSYPPTSSDPHPTTTTTTDHPLPSSSHCQHTVATSDAASSACTTDPSIWDLEAVMEPKGTVGRRWRLFFMSIYGEVLTHPFVKMIVLLIFASYLGVAIWGWTKLRQGLDMRKLAAEGSYLANFFDAQEDKFNDYGNAVDIFFPIPLDWCSADVKREIEELNYFLKGKAYVLHMKDGMFEFFQSSLGSDLINKSQFYCNRMLSAWLRTPRGSIYNSDFVWKEDGGVGSWKNSSSSEQKLFLKTWKLTVVPPFLESSEKQSKFMDLIREDTSRFAALKIRTYNRMFIYYESDRNMLSSALRSMGIAALAMFLVSLLLLSSIWSGILVLITLVMIDAGVIGFMHFWNLPLNMLTMVNLIISIGFSVDYSAHMCHTFSHCLGVTRNLRTMESLVLMGNPVLHGAVSTQLAVVALAFSNSYILRVFFKMMTLVLVLGVSHGLIFLPVLLSLVGPMPSSNKSKPSRSFSSSLRTSLTSPFKCLRFFKFDS